MYACVCEYIYLSIGIHVQSRGSQQVSSSVAFQFAFWDSFSLNLDLLFWLAWQAIELMGFCRYSTSAEVRGVLPHLPLMWMRGGGGFQSYSLRLLQWAFTHWTIFLAVCWDLFLLLSQVRGFSTGLWTEELLSCLIPSPCLSFYPSSPWISVKVPLRPAIPSSWHLQNFESNLFKPFIKLICFMYFIIVMKMD